MALKAFTLPSTRLLDYRRRNEVVQVNLDVVSRDKLEQIKTIYDSDEVLQLQVAESILKYISNGRNQPSVETVGPFTITADRQLWPLRHKFDFFRGQEPLQGHEFKYLFKLDTIPKAPEAPITNGTKRSIDVDGASPSRVLQKLSIFYFQHLQQLLQRSKLARQKDNKSEKDPAVVENNVVDAAQEALQYHVNRYLGIDVDASGGIFASFLVGFACTQLLQTAGALAKRDNAEVILSSHIREALLNSAQVRGFAKMYRCLALAAEDRTADHSTFYQDKDDEQTMIFLEDMYQDHLKEIDEALSKENNSPIVMIDSCEQTPSASLPSFGIREKLGSSPIKSMVCSPLNCKVEKQETLTIASSPSPPKAPFFSNQNASQPEPFENGVIADLCVIL